MRSSHLVQRVADAQRQRRVGLIESVLAVHRVSITLPIVPVDQVCQFDEIVKIISRHFLFFF